MPYVQRQRLIDDFGIHVIHGAASRMDPTATAFGLRAKLWDFDIISEWTREFWKEAEPFASSVYVNHIAEDEPGRVTAAYRPNYARLMGVKRQYDPNNLFRLNYNIRPA